MTSDTVAALAILGSDIMRPREYELVCDRFVYEPIPDFAYGYVPSNAPGRRRNKPHVVAKRRAANKRARKQRKLP